ncbi:unnamed protein product [Triticum turgidum subsp. durum]|uniref:3'-N-debenzoyl-2'-deoxytaxol N-benzoyltransferase n=1 Tax=Triticum turgidum subsp. durum TaxID=4567 RepID=A0A9R0VSL3_TRITD|nr:unnamed protein product [Triticum turgidum subsp. durum]
MHIFSTLPRNVKFIEHTSRLGWKEGQPLIVDPRLYASRKQDIFYASTVHPAGATHGVADAGLGRVRGEVYYAHVLRQLGVAAGGLLTFPPPPTTTLCLIGSFARFDMTSSSTPTVTKSPPALIPPAGPTPRGTLALSSIDKTVAGSGFVCLIQVFSPPSPSAARRDLGAAAAVAAMREGFARALVPYYPVAGRVAPSGLAVDCTGEGIWFVEAAASCALADVDGLDCCPLPIPQKLLLPRPPPGEKLDGLIFMVQATRFTCGGFAVGIIFRHAVFDGQGAAQFLTAAGELARGLKAPSVAPVWDRDAIPDPPGPLPGQVTEFRLVTQLHYVRPPAPRRGGVRVVLRCVEEPHAAALAVELAKFA